MNTKRLTILADFLDAIPIEFNFNLTVWGCYKSTPPSDSTNMLDALHDNPLTKDAAKLLFVDCGYTACAIGHACMSHKLRAEGLEYAMNGTRLIPMFKDEEDWAAVHAFFDIGPRTATSLFAASAYNFRYVTAKEVAARIRGHLLK